jgi:hypothetical protein
VRCLLGLALLAAPLLGEAGGVLDSSISQQEGEYALSIEARIDAPVDFVYHLITDYNHLAAINPDIRESRILRTFSPTKHRIRTVTRVCVLLYCRDVVQTQDMLQGPGYLITAEILPQDSDFRSGSGRWQLSAEGNATLLHFRAEIVPDFYMPTLIGTWLMRREMVTQMADVVRHIEARYEGSAASR